MPLRGGICRAPYRDLTYPELCEERTETLAIARLSPEDWLTYENNVRKAFGAGPIDKITPV